VRVGTPPSIAAGPVPWGVPAAVALDAEAPGPVDELLRRAARRPVVAQVRDAHRHPVVLRLLDRLAANGPLVVVEWGWPGPRPHQWPSSAVRVCAFGTSLPGHAAVLELLGSHGYDALGEECG
jgi:beta-N-acetylhexosaminidase